ncbi:MAG: inorganic phosphate transporter, partial [Campylobacterales bacterium]|nr:inorganic phosphate transporter [Campylobacterales bacterium]
GAGIAAGFLFAIKKTIIFKEDQVTSAKKYVPFYVAIMAWAFVMYLTLKGFKHIWPSVITAINKLPFISMEMTDKPSFTTAVIFGLLSAVTVYIANDVANAVGPLAAISDAVVNGGISSKASISLWVMAVGALGIALGLMLYGAKLIKTVGAEITELNQVRAFSIAMAAAITVILASQLGLPVSSTHIAIGGVFGVGFLREYLHITSQDRRTVAQDLQFIENEKAALNAYKTELNTLEAKSEKSKNEYERVVELYKLIAKEEELLKSTKKHIKKIEKVQYVKRDTVKKIIAAWIITVPAAAIIAGVLFYAMKGIMI